MRQGLIQLVLLGVLLFLESLIVPGTALAQARTFIRDAQGLLVILLFLTLLLSIIQRFVLMFKAHSQTSMWRLIKTEPHGSFLLLHIGLLLLLPAFAYTKMGGIEAVMELPVGGEGRIAHFEDGRRIVLPFTVRALSFKTEHYPTGEISQFFGKVALNAGEHTLAEQTITVGEPLKYEGYRFLLFRYGDRGSRVTGNIRNIADPMETTPYQGLTGGDIQFPDGSKASLVLMNAQTTRNTETGYRNVGKSLLYEVEGLNGGRYEVMNYASVDHVIDWRPLAARNYESIHVLRDRAKALDLPFDYYLTVGTTEVTQSIGLMVRYHPGLHFLLFAALMVVAGVAWQIQSWSRRERARLLIK